MQPVVIVTLHKRIETVLLLQKVVAGGFGRLFLEGQVHALMAPVLLRMARFDAFDPNTKS